MSARWRSAIRLRRHQTPDSVERLEVLDHKCPEQYSKAWYLQIKMKYHFENKLKYDFENIDGGILDRQRVHLFRAERSDLTRALNRPRSIAL